jgi:CRISPR-associated protein Cmr6
MPNNTATYNPGLLFYKHYFRSEPGEGKRATTFEKEWLVDPPKKNTKCEHHFEVKNKRLFDTAFHAPPIPPHSLSIPLVTTYPGLLVGLGYNHDVAPTAALNVGFSFDYTTGLPLLPGSSVKGILRSAFPGEDYKRAQAAKATNKKNAAENDEQWYETVANHKAAWLQRQLPACAHLSDDYLKDYLRALENELFECFVPHPKQAGERLYLPITLRAKCYDALITKAKDGKILGPDAITPHHRHDGAGGIPDRYREPNPLSLLKVLPEVTFTFRFAAPAKEVHPIEDNHYQPTLSPEEVKKLFKNILLEYGVGAKSRQGYGRLVEDLNELPNFSAHDQNYVFTDPELEPMLRGRLKKKKERAKPVQAKKPAKKKQLAERKYKVGEPVTATFVDHQPGDNPSRGRSAFTIPENQSWVYVYWSRDIAIKEYNFSKGQEIQAFIEEVWKPKGNVKTIEIDYTKLNN